MLKRKKKKVSVPVAKQMLFSHDEATIVTAATHRRDQTHTRVVNELLERSTGSANYFIAFF